MRRDVKTIVLRNQSESESFAVGTFAERKRGEELTFSFTFKREKNLLLMIENVNYH